MCIYIHAYIHTYAYTYTSPCLYLCPHTKPLCMYPHTKPLYMSPHTTIVFGPTYLPTKRELGTPLPVYAVLSH